MTVDGELYRRVLLPPVRKFTDGDAEAAHIAFVKAMSFVTRHPRLMNLLPARRIDDPFLSQNLMDGLVFRHPLGIAAGMDKEGTIYPALRRLIGPSHMEIGGITPEAQPGNPRPRVFRANKRNLINAMGFPNPGIEAVIANMVAAPEVDIPIGMQFAKQKQTPDDQAPDDYARLMRAAAGLQKKGKGLPAYYVVNVSSPNTPGLRALQEKSKLAEIFAATTEALDEQKGLAKRPRRRLLVKLAPELDEAEIADVIELVEEFDTGGVILTNTTLTRPIESRHNDRPGGFSGHDLHPLSSKLVRFAAGKLPTNRVLVATGGIDSGERAWEMLRHADLIGAYTGLVLHGPDLFRQVGAYLSDRMRAEGISSLAELRSGQRPQASGD